MLHVISQFTQHCTWLPSKLKIHLRARKGNLTLINNFLDDATTAILITLILYFIALVLLYARTTSHRLNDPSQALDFDSLCNGSTHATNHENSQQVNHNDLSVLTTFISHTLNKLNYKSFICYQTLYELLRLDDSKRQLLMTSRSAVHLCVYDPHADPASLAQNVVAMLGLVDLERFLLNSKLVQYEFNQMLGFFRVRYHTATVYLYMFSRARADRTDFEGVRRSGVVYTQFQYLISVLKTLNQLTGLVQFNHTSQSGVSVNILNRLPMYMLENESVDVKVRLGQSYFSLPVEPFNALMFFYPDVWWRHRDNCTL
jgi:hypothetical protein